MNKYEMVLILKSNAEDEERQQVLDRLLDAIRENGTVGEIDDWGIRKLAYEINYNKEGYYYVVNYEAEPTVVAEVERRARILDQVLRYLTVKKEA
ncbi:MAG: 30S ribosomal protein S6 [Peptoniphilaceae bacterium]|nr:30S ribosomal protein S6 [Peptoniphilaceae bacterium]MCI6660692.1 30S ribosomal protein S6 [Peptoniphilaceae bacterium]MDD7433389.1 30S ribosomal protein S6 [Peptoniphilaceae bacterium]MDY3076155.1 30S ribosomal protein S6 [Peptoniphilaceae bacterium]MDY3986693.1 30S ribosomal protein S6 [Peptoniphilaceae bacterium]